MQHDEPSYQLLNFDPERSARHMTVLQVQRSRRMHSTAPFQIDNKELKHIILVGNVHDYEQHDRYMSFNLNDGTGVIRVQKWNEGPNWAPQLAADTCPYVRVVGQIKQFKDWKKVDVIKIEVIADPHEPYHHLLSAIFDTLVHQRGPPPRLESGNTGNWGSSGTTDPHKNDSRSEPPAGGPQRGMQASRQPPQAPKNNSVNLSHYRATDRSAFIRRHIVNELQYRMTYEWGVHIDEIIHAIFEYVPDLTEEEFSDCIEILMKKEYIYTTFEEGCYRCTDVEYLD